MSIRKIQTVTSDKGEFAHIYRDSDLQEYVVRFHYPQPIGYLKEADYFTNDKDDAISTAKFQLKVK